MKLKTSLQVSAVFPITLALMVSLSLYLRSRRVTEMMIRIQACETMSQAASQLKDTSYRCVYLADKDAINDWRAQFETVSKLVDGVEAEGVGRVSRDRIKTELKAADDTFAALADKFKAGSRTGSELLAHTREVVRSSFDLVKAVQAAAGQGQETMDMIFLVFIAVVGLMMSADILMISRQVFGRVSSLTGSARTISQGTMEGKPLVDRTRDEIGELYSAFGTMVEVLRKAQVDLKKEVDEHKRIAQSARDANIRLSDALGKLKAAQQQAIQQERLQALEQIAKGVAMSYDEALVPIAAMTDFLIGYPEEMKNESAMMAHVMKINDAARQALRSVGSIAEFFRPAKEAGSSTVNLNDLVQQAVEMTESKWADKARPAKEAILVRTELGKIPSIAGDGIELRQAIVNLILNGIEAMPRGGTIVAATRLDDSTVSLRVTDTGEGMNDEVRRRCLEPFYTTRGPNSTGMGLAIVNTVVRKHGGTLDIQSGQGIGTTVTVQLPASVKPGKEEIEVRLALPKSLRILIVDDEFTARELVARMLRAEGMDVKTADTATNGLKEFETGKYDVVILDQAMPDMGGDEVAKQMKEAVPGIKILMLTGLGDIIGADGKRPAGVDYVLSKPAEKADILGALARVWGGAA